jgi:UDP-glucose 4-epimerase
MKLIDDSLKMLASRRILVTGASGFIGRHVVALGQRVGVELHAISRSGSANLQLREWHVNIRNFKAVKETVLSIEPDGILHLAAEGVAYGSSLLPQLLEVNAIGLAHLLEAAAELKRPPFVVIAASGFEYAPSDRPLSEVDAMMPNSAYGVSKASATMLAALYATRIPITVLRLFSLYGPGEPKSRLTPYIITKAIRGEPVDLTAGEQIRDYTYVEDAAETFWRALATPETAEGLRILNVGTGIQISLRQFIEALAGVLENHGVKADLRFGARPYRADELMFYCADVSKLQSSLSWVPDTPLLMGLEKSVGAYL